MLVGDAELRTLPQPVIARVQGPALAAGASSWRRATWPSRPRGRRSRRRREDRPVLLDADGPARPAVPPKAAMEMLLTGEPISADRALALGLVNRVVPGGPARRGVGELTDAILAASPLTIRIGKAAFYEELGLDEPRPMLGRRTSWSITRAARRPGGDLGLPGEASTEMDGK